MVDSDFITSDEMIGKRWKEVIDKKDKYYERYLKEADRFTESLESYLSHTIDLEDEKLYWGLLRCIGVSNNAQTYLTQEDILEQIHFILIRKQGEDHASFLHRLRDRFLVGCGENLNGCMKNKSSLIGEKNLLDCFLNQLIQHTHKIHVNIDMRWVKYKSQDVSQITGIAWEIDGRNSRVLLLRHTVPEIDINVDMALLSTSYKNIDLTYSSGIESVDLFSDDISPINRQKHCDIHNYLICGELKSGVYPGGATQLWKSALGAALKIKRTSPIPIKTFIILATVVPSIALEIEHHLKAKNIDKFANLTKEDQLKELCEWLISV